MAKKEEEKLKMRAGEMWWELTRELVSAHIGASDGGADPLPVKSGLEWQGSASQLNELATSFAGLVYIDGRKALIKELREAVGRLFNVDLSNGAVLDNKRRNKKNGKPEIFDILKENYGRRVLKLDNDQEDRYGKG